MPVTQKNNFKSMLKRIILPYGYGQTCNQLFQVSHWIPAAKEFSLPLYFPGFQRYAHLFVGTAGQHYPRFPKTAPELGSLESALSRLCAYAARVPHVNMDLLLKWASLSPWIVTEDGDGCVVPSKILEAPRVAAGRSLWIRDWRCQDHAGVAKHRLCIKAFFSPVPEIQRRVDACIRQNRSSDMVLVGVHLRRGDYIKWADGKYYYDAPVIRSLMQQMSQALQGCNLRFLLVSNQPVDRSNYDGFDIAIGLGDPAGDLFSLAACDYIMGPPSTFTVWASFFGDVPLYEISDPLKPLRLEYFRVCEG